MRKLSVFFAIIMAIIIAQPNASAQINLNNLKNKAQKEVKNKKKSKTTENTTTTTNTETTTEKKTQTEQIQNQTHEAPTNNTATEAKQEVGSYFYTAFKSTDYKKEVNIGDELFVNFNLGKTMFEYGQEKGMDGFTQYGFVVISINGKQTDVIGPYSFASNYSKVWDQFSVPLAISPNFLETIQKDQSLLETSQDIWLFQQLFQENSIAKRYVTSAIGQMKDGQNTLKVEFGLGEKSDKAPKMIVCSGQVVVVSEAVGKKELFKKGPKNLVPLDDNEIGTFSYSTETYTLGAGEFSATLALPNPPKYYNMKWCKATSCDYDHGNLNMVAFLDNDFLASWTVKFDENVYNTQKQYDMVLFPATDKDLDSGDAPFNNTVLSGKTNSVVYALYDKLYGGKISEGTHTLRLKLYSSECVPYSATFENTAEYHNTWPAIAENEVKFNVSAPQTAKLEQSSTAKKLTHATGEWVAVDAYLKKNLAAGMPEIQILDVATTIKWKVTVNALGTPIYRDCKADMVYVSSQFGCRTLRSVNIREDYNAGKYGNPYSTEVLNSYFFASGMLLNSMHFPVPVSKLK